MELNWKKYPLSSALKLPQFLGISWKPQTCLKHAWNSDVGCVPLHPNFVKLSHAEMKASKVFFSFFTFYKHKLSLTHGCIFPCIFAE